MRANLLRSNLVEGTQPMQTGAIRRGSSLRRRMAFNAHSAERPWRHRHAFPTLFPGCLGALPLRPHQMTYFQTIGEIRCER